VEVNGERPIGITTIGMMMIGVESLARVEEEVMVTGGTQEVMVEAGMNGVVDRVKVVRTVDGIRLGTSGEEENLTLDCRVRNGEMMMVGVTRVALTLTLI